MFEADELLSKMFLSLEYEVAYTVLFPNKDGFGNTTYNYILDTRVDYTRSYEPYKDEISTNLLSLLISSERFDRIGVSTVLATRIQTEIHHAVQSCGMNPYEELLSKAAAIKKALSPIFPKEIARPARPSRQEPVLKSITGQIGDWGQQGFAEGYLTGVYIKRVLTRSSRVAWKKKFFDLLRNGQRSANNLKSTSDTELGHSQYSCPTDPVFFHRNNPLYCDLEALKITLGMEKAGVSYCNEKQSFVAVAHIYNALDQMGLLGEQRWPAMEEMSQLLVKQVFLGERPSQISLLPNRYRICVGWPLEVSTYLLDYLNRLWTTREYNAD